MRRAPAKTTAKQPAAPVKHGGISSVAVQKRTGKGWNQWFAVLDRAGARKWNHTKIASYLYEKRKCPGWWNQMVAVGYEQARGLREKYQTAGGYSANASRTLAATVSALSKAWTDAKARERWLPKAPLEITKTTAGKSVRLRWTKGDSRVAVMFYPKGAGKCQVTIDHTKLSDAKAVTRIKAYWKSALDRLQKTVEK